MLFDFRSPHAFRPWVSMDDCVMGGHSTSHLIPGQQGTAIYTGMISLENNGGFASTVAEGQSYDLSGCEGIALRVRGDGKTYGFYLRDNSFRVRYQADFTAPNEQWKTIMLPWSAFTPRIFGHTLPVAPSLNRAFITAFGIIISHEQEGPFHLEIETISAYHSA